MKFRRSRKDRIRLTVRSRNTKRVMRLLKHDKVDVFIYEPEMNEPVTIRYVGAHDVVIYFPTLTRVNEIEARRG